MKILLIRLSAIGDVVRTLPALTCLRRGFPDARIAWAVEEAAHDILRDQPDLDETPVFPRRALARVLLHPDEIGGALEALRSFRQALRSSRFDLVIDFQGTVKSALIARMTGAARIVGLGRGHAREMSHLLYTEPVALPRKRMSRVDRALALVSHLGISIEDATSDIPVRAEDSAFIETFLARIGVPVPPAVVFPGTSRTQAYKRYSPRHFARAADIVAQRTGAPVVVAWGPGEEEIADEVIAGMTTPATLAPRLSLGQLTALIRRCRVFIAGDTGPMHIAWTVGAPVVAVYGPTDPVTNRPGGAFSAVAHERYFCSPCRNRGCVAVTCLEQLPPETVADAALGVIAGAERGRSSGLRHMTMGPGSDPSSGP
jgi:lipopolysaccharide heptosyltransferase I